MSSETHENLRRLPFLQKNHTHTNIAIVIQLNIHFMQDDQWSQASATKYQRKERDPGPVVLLPFALF